MGLAYGAAETLTSKTPSSGNRMIGKRAVPAIGITSVTHQVAINVATAAVRQPSGLNPSGGLDSTINRNRNRPPKNPAGFVMLTELSGIPPFKNSSWLSFF